MVARVHATYTNGVLKPKVALDLPEGAEVELQIRSASATATTTIRFGDLAGIWSHLLDSDVSNMEKAIYQLRRQSDAKLNQLAHQVRERGDDQND
jgi:predicted DNA-binding antitoxin AbrB/MazE fold protein